MSDYLTVLAALVALSLIAFGVYNRWRQRAPQADVWFGRLSNDGRVTVPTLFVRCHSTGDFSGVPQFLAFDVRNCDAGSGFPQIGNRSLVALADVPGHFEWIGRGNRAFYLELEFDWLPWAMHDERIGLAQVSVSLVDEHKRETVVGLGALKLDEARALLGNDVDLPPMPVADIKE